ncbi:hypothetical protein GE21DRAFT_8620 [Neurospora crassa]|uniref:Uncharacterized protein n=1 Tax=Neurospora crassa (strain ATCC 24698 / 74-OR23-1A / CBS 708.71 / DSM 1257 / FGSC 987) TaxID=367110 RepID=V5IKK7_NEUCR|nr:hypothetical protein NCU07077 [Neurospora crassa OR74A]ESA42103.1 hypothetical protein NCU07077 [Neurospora crassa OR74A]KHE86850.1 hypothetical protein GE21DRAFT_8620 [Neurospora crassa]|eukprot:XP_011394997.1 hypothetical protein NCU07077 [Neurospora crassa OR74A]
MSGNQQGQWPPFVGYQIPNMSGNQQGDLPQFEVNQGPMISGAQPGEEPKFGEDETPTGNILYEHSQADLQQFDVNQMPTGSMHRSQQSELPQFDPNELPGLFENQHGELQHFDVNQAPMLFGDQQGVLLEHFDDVNQMPTGSMYESQQGELPQFDANEMPGIYENLQQFNANQMPMLFDDQQGVLLEHFDANQMPSGSMYGSQQGESSLSPSNPVPMMFDNQQGESSLSPANQVPTMSSNQQGELQQFNATQMPTMSSNQQGELQQFNATQMPTMSSNQQGELQQFNATQMPIMSSNQQGELSLSPANQVPTMSSNQQGELPQVNANQRSMMFGSQQGESSLSPANQAPLGATSAQGGQGAKQSATIECVMATLTRLAAICEGIETTLPMDVYRQLQRDYNALVSTVQAKIDLSREPAPQPILEASIRLESRLFQLMHHTPVDDVASPVLGRLAAPPCQLESMNSVAMAQTVATLNQAFPWPCRSCASTGIACQRSFIDEQCAFCESSNRECKTNYPMNTGPPPVSGGLAGPAANTRRLVDNLFQEHRKGVLDVVHLRVRDAERLWGMKETWLHCSMEMGLVQNPPGWMAASRGWAVRECVQGRLSRMKLMARDTPRAFSFRMGAFGLFRHEIARNLFQLDTYWLAGDFPEQRLETRNTLVDLLSFCNITAGYICSAQSYLALAHREFLRANRYMVDQGFVEI